MNTVERRSPELFPFQHSLIHITDPVLIRSDSPWECKLHKGREEWRPSPRCRPHGGCSHRVGQGSPTPRWVMVHGLLGTGPHSRRWAKWVSSVFTAAPQCSPFTPRWDYLVAEKQAQDSHWFCIMVNCIIISLYNPCNNHGNKVHNDYNVPESCREPWSMEKLSSMKLVPGDKKVRDRWGTASLEKWRNGISFCSQWNPHWKWPENQPVLPHGLFFL